LRDRVGIGINAMETFFKVKTSEEVLQIIEQFEAVVEERVDLDQGLGRILSRDLVSPEDLPAFLRSAMDGYAVRARDTFGASESLPALLQVQGEVRMGALPEVAVSGGQAVKISTGGMLPQGADGVVMKEYCDPLDAQTLEVSKTITPLENVIQPGDDFKKGTTVLRRGRRLRAQDLGALAGLGQERISVHRRPKVAILSTGDEIVPIHVTPGPGQVRDVNRYSLMAFCQRVGAVPLFLGVYGDDFETLRDGVNRGLSEADTVWISGGSSVGTRDLTLKVFETLEDFELLVHGISISPGKPTIIGRTGLRPVVGLPGHVSSALIVAEVFLSRLIERLSGLTGGAPGVQPHVVAELSRNIESRTGRDDYIRVRLSLEGDRWRAEPIFGKSGLISILVDSDGLIRVDRNTEGLYEGDGVKVMLFDSIHGGGGW
jgi:molybdopterin molybdotransferase